MKKTNVKWMMELIDGTILCYSVQTDSNGEDPLIKYKDDFEEGDYYIVDSLNEDGLEKYDVYPEDDSFIMVPKKDVVRTFKEDYKIKASGIGLSGKQLREDIEKRIQPIVNESSKLKEEDMKSIRDRYFTIVLRDDDGKDVLAVLLVKKVSGLTRDEINKRIQQGKQNGWEKSDGWQVSDIIDSIGPEAIEVDSKDFLV